MLSQACFGEERQTRARARGENPPTDAPTRPGDLPGGLPGSAGPGVDLGHVASGRKGDAGFLEPRNGTRTASLPATSQGSQGTGATWCGGTTWIWGRLPRVCGRASLASHEVIGNRGSDGPNGFGADAESDLRRWWCVGPQPLGRARPSPGREAWLSDSGRSSRPAQSQLARGCGPAAAAAAPAAAAAAAAATAAAAGEDSPLSCQPVVVSSFVLLAPSHASHV